VGEAPGAAVILCDGGLGGGLDEHRERDDRGDERNQEGEAAEDHIRHADGVCQLRGGGSGSDEDEEGSNLWSDGGCGGVEDAAEINAPRTFVRWAKDADVGIDRDLQQCEPAAYDEECEEEERVRDCDRGWDEEEEAGRHDAECGDDAGFVPDAADDPAAGQRHNEVGAEE